MVLGRGFDIANVTPPENDVKSPRTLNFSDPLRQRTLQSSKLQVLSVLNDFNKTRIITHVYLMNLQR